jgi:hypothetical protein
MNRYLLRSLVAVLTFSIGIAIGSFAHRNTRNSWHYKRHDCDYAREYRVSRAVLVQSERSSPWASPSISVDSMLVDPLKLTYSSTTPLTNDLGRQRVEFLVENNTKREVASFSLSYNSRWRNRNQGGGGGVMVQSGTNVVSIECDADQSLTIWVSSVEFKDGSRWSNKRHSN